MSSNTKQSIIKEAKILFGYKGFEGTSVSEIADAVGIKKSSLYYFFSNKEEIYFITLITIMKDITDMFLSSMNNSKPEDLELVIKKGLKKGLQIGSGLTSIKSIAKINNPDLKREVYKNYQVMLTAIKEYLELYGIKETNFVAQLLVDCQQMYMLRKGCGINQSSIDNYASKLANFLLACK